MPPEEVTKVLKRVQEFDPPGIAARDLQECLLIQSRFLVESSPLLKRIIREHLRDLETKNYNLIAKKLKGFNHNRNIRMFDTGRL